MRHVGGERSPAAPIAIGIFLFGFALTFLGGLSAVGNGTAQLIAGLLAFVGGTLLTFAGFRRAARKSTDGATDPGEPTIDLRLTGWAVGAFSLGLVLGAPAGIALRLFGPTKAAPAPAGGSAQPQASGTASPTPAAPAMGFSMQAAPTSACDEVARDLVSKDNAGNALLPDLKTLFQKTCCTDQTYAKGRSDCAPSP